jgi:ABC-type nitrate/sulfonate/bicarbonate transport system substrate-binding protein
MHNFFLLRYYLAEAGLNPDTDVQLVVLPAEMVANLRAGNIDGSALILSTSAPCTRKSASSTC